MKSEIFKKASAKGGKLKRTKKEIEQDINDLKEAIAVTEDKEDKDMLEEGLKEFEKELSEFKEATPAEKKPKVVKKEVSKPAPAIKSKITEKDGVVLVSLEGYPDWVVTIEEKGGKWHSSCCDDDFKHPIQASRAAAIKAAEEFLYCKTIWAKYKHEAKVAVKARKEYKAKHGETNVVMTVKNAVETVSNKVEKLADKKKPITVVQAAQIEKSLNKIVATIKVTMKTEKDGKAFIKKLIAHLQKLL